MPLPSLVASLSLATVLQKHWQGLHRDFCKSFWYPGRQFVCDWTLGSRAVRHTFCLSFILSSSLSRLKAFAWMCWAALPILSGSCQHCTTITIPMDSPSSPTIGIQTAHKKTLSFILSGVFQSLSSYWIQPFWHSSCKCGSSPQVSGCVLFLSICVFKTQAHQRWHYEVTLLSSSAYWDYTMEGTWMLGSESQGLGRHPNISPAVWALSLKRG